MQRTRFKLVRQVSVGGIVLGHHHEARRILVQAMHDSRAKRAVHCRKIALEMVQEPCGKRTLAHAAPRMHHQVARLVQHHYIVVFVHDVERNLFGFERTRFLLDKLFHDNDHARFHAEILGSRGTAHLHLARGNQLLHVGARNVIHNADKELVYAFTVMFFFDEIIHSSGRGVAFLRFSFSSLICL